MVLVKITNSIHSVIGIAKANGWENIMALLPTPRIASLFAKNEIQATGFKPMKEEP